MIILLLNIINMIKKISKYNYDNKLKTYFNGLDKTAKHILKNGLYCCFVLGIIATAILSTYTLIFTYPLIFNIGFVLFKLSIIFAVEFIICAFAADKVKNELI